MPKKGAASASRRNQAPAAEGPKSITLPDGTKVPMGALPGMNPEQMTQLAKYMVDNPEFAKQTMAQAQNVMKNPALARQMMSMPMNQQVQNQDQALMNQILAKDPELKPIFDDIKENGMQAMSKYWDDREVMAKINKKIEEMKIGGDANSYKKVEAKDLPHAAKLGDLEAVKKFLDDGEDINQQDGRGVSPLGAAVGFNRVTVVKELLERGADLMALDGQGNCLMHYAAGYGRVEIAQMLLDAGAKADVANKAGQTPIDVSKMNKEVTLQEMLEKHLGISKEEDENTTEQKEAEEK